MDPYQTISDLMTRLHVLDAFDTGKTKALQKRYGKSILGAICAKTAMMFKGEVGVYSSKHEFYLCKTNEDLQHAFGLSDDNMKLHIISMDGPIQSLITSMSMMNPSENFDTAKKGQYNKESNLYGIKPTKRRCGKTMGTALYIPPSCLLNVLEINPSENLDITKEEEK